jgi:hypothetical protein
LFIALPMIMLSGSNTPLESMPWWLATIMQVSPSTHFVSFARAIPYRGAGFVVVWPPFSRGRCHRRALFRHRAFPIPTWCDAGLKRAKREQTPLTFGRKVRSLSQAYEDRHPRTVMPYAWRSLIHDFHDPGSVVLWEPAEVMTLDRSVRSTSAATPTGR